MRENKRKRLKARGWKVGSAKDFLGLDDQEARVHRAEAAAGLESA